MASAAVFQQHKIAASEKANQPSPLKRKAKDMSQVAEIADAGQVASADHHGHAIAGRAVARRCSAVSSPLSSVFVHGSRLRPDLLLNPQIRLESSGWKRVSTAVVAGMSGVVAE